MRVVETQIVVSHFEASSERHVGYVTFIHVCDETGEQGAAHFKCRAKLAEGAANPTVENALFEEACRQVNFMPEYRLGQKVLSFDELTEMRATA